MEALASAQLELGKVIEQNYANFKKDSKERKTQDYANKRIVILETNFEIFKKNHNVLSTFESEHGEYPYYQNEYHDQIETIYKKHLAGLKAIFEDPQSKIQELSSENNSIIALLKQQKALLSYTSQVVADIQTQLTKAQPTQYYKYKVELLQKQKQLLDSNRQAVWAEYEGFENSEDKIYCDEIDNLVQDTIISLQTYLYEARQSSYQDSQESAVKLPKMSLPTFDGDYLKWVQFKDLFEQMVNKQAISETQKMYYLVNHLTGDAHTLIQHLPVCSQNFSTAWDILTHRYDNQRLLVTAFLNKLLLQPNAQPDSPSSIRRLHDTTKECLMGLKNLGVNVEYWDAILIHILLKKMDKATHILYEQSLENPRMLDKLSNALDFLEIRFQSLETIISKPPNSSSYQPKSKSSALVVSSKRDVQCAACNQAHPLFACNEFKEMTLAKRLEVVHRHNLCRNCLKPGHKATNCSRGSCTRCQTKHNTLLHHEPEAEQSTQVTQIEKRSNQTHKKEKAKSKTTLVSQFSGEKSYVLLGTIGVSVTTNNGHVITCRALLDSGSQLNFVTERLAKQLNIKGIADPIKIQGIGRNSNEATRRLSLRVSSLATNCTLQLEAFILPQITTEQRAKRLDTTAWKIPNDITLADPKFNNPGPIDMLIGAAHYFELVADGRINLGKGFPVLQNTQFGWIVAGKTNTNTPDSASCYIGTQETTNLDNLIKSFWEIENVENENPTMTNAERKCEEIFKETTTRDHQGRFIVRLPFVTEPSNLGESRQRALQRFLAIERKLNRNPELKIEYSAFMQEYIQLGHMTEVSNISGPHYFLPHHNVLKPDSETTKLRVVFDASAKTSNNISLNDILYTGPKIQEDLFSILIRFRIPKYVCSADIEKMYRQIMIDERDRKYQLVLWRENLQDEIKCYQLNTVTYGVTTAPYLAIRCMKKFAADFEASKPFGARAIQQNKYVENALFGADTLMEALETQNQIKDILKQGGFRLRKWCGNHESFLKNVPIEDTKFKVDFTDESQQQVKTLGLTWIPNEDEFRIVVDDSLIKKKSHTKRQILSSIARLFDPLGLIGSVTVTAKLILQQLWSLKLDWDDIVPEELQAKWNKFQRNIQALNNIRIPRHVIGSHIASAKQLHVFCDASEKAYGAAVYVRSELTDGTIIVRLLCAKSKTAPIKPITLPRLELCAAKLGTDLLLRVKRDLKWQEPIYLWTDSEIVLSWLRAPASSLQKFVANRTAAVQEATLNIPWRHVPSKQNPADLISRGVWPQKLQNYQQWFIGPIFLHGHESYWPKTEISSKCYLEKKQNNTVLSVSQFKVAFVDSLAHLSSIVRINRVVAYSLRFVFNSKPTNPIRQGDLSVHELEEAMEVILKEVQRQTFPDELKALQKYNGVSTTSNISSLTPFLDERGLIRVGGRLENADIPFEAKHPVLLPYQHHITRLIIRRIHHDNNHIGQLGLLAITRQRFWPINGKTITRSIVQQCVLCAKQKPKLMQQIMGNLPKDRVQPSRPFIKTGVDFGGPLYIRLEIRGKPPQQAYIAVFCCFATKAIHIEVVKNLTTDAFIQALKRFIGRRGYCETIYCDNATNFVGANNQLMELQDVISSEKASKQIQEFCSFKKINFKIIPPRAPHFGGLWEAAIKSAKDLLYKTLAQKPLTYEELTTLTVEIEAILNSRPLTSISEDPNDLAALTPGHLLIGEPVNATVNPYAQPNTQPLLDRWKDLTNAKQQFWTRWSKEYLSELQQRHKWKNMVENVQNGTMVIIKEDNAPVSSWPLGRIVNTIKGKDGRVRVVEVKTKSGVFKRPVHKLAPLPIQTKNESANIAELNETMATSMNKRAQKTHAPSTRIQQEAPKAKRSCKTSLLLTSLLVLGCISPTQASSSIEITPFSTQPGLYFENAGSVSTVVDEWNLIVYYNMRGFWTEYDLISQGTHQLTHLCSRIHEHTPCTDTIDQFKAFLTELTNNNQLLKPHDLRRHKRAPLDIVGNIASSLFGVLDSQYADKMAQIIDQLDNNDHHLLDLIQKQTSIINSTANIVHKSQEITQSQMRQFYKYMNNTAFMINGINKSINIQEVVEDFHSLSIKLILIMSNFQRMQTILINVLTDTQHGKVSPLLITPAQLHQQIQLIKEGLPPHTRPPVNPDDLLALYGIMSIEGRAAQNQILFRVKMPLVADTKYELLAITPVPILINGTFSLIKPTSRYILINPQKGQYHHLRDDELVTMCSRIQHSEYICKLTQLPHDKNTNEGTCEVDILFHSPNIPVCEFVTNQLVPRWTKLLQTNSWIYATTQMDIITVICSKQLSSKQIAGTGIVTLPKGCVIKDGKSTIETGHSITRSITTSFTPSRNITDVLIRNKTSTNISYTSVEDRNMSAEVRNLQHQIEDLQRNTVLPQLELTTHDLHQYGVSYASLLLLFTAAGILGVRYLCTRRRTPTPAPRMNPEVRVQPSSSDFVAHIQD